MNSEFGLKELYDVTFRATYPIEVGNRTIEPQEVVAAFDKIMLANFNEIRSTTRASGGFDNRGLVFWESTKEVQISLTQGIFSQTQLALLSDAKLVTESLNQLAIHQRELTESNEAGVISLRHPALSSEPVFVYNRIQGDKLSFTVIDDSHLQVETPYTDVLVDYSYTYTNSYRILTVGQPLTRGFLSLEGKTRVKDDITGQTHTGLIQVPKLKLMSDLSMRLGRDAAPLVGRLDATAIPIGDRSNKEVMSLLFLDDDIDSDM